IPQFTHQNNTSYTDRSANQNLILIDRDAPYRDYPESPAVSDFENNDRQNPNPYTVRSIVPHSESDHPLSSSRNRNDSRGAPHPGSAASPYPPLPLNSTAYPPIAPTANPENRFSYSNMGIVLPPGNTSVTTAAPSIDIYPPPPPD